MRCRFIQKNFSKLNLISVVVRLFLATERLLELLLIGGHLQEISSIMTIGVLPRVKRYLPSYFALPAHRIRLSIVDLRLLDFEW